MQEFQQIEDQIAQCDQEIAALTEAKNILLAQRKEIRERMRQAELPALLAKIQQLGFSKSELGFGAKKKDKSEDTGPKKYRNPENGAEWSGKGNKPRWIGGKDKELFLNPAYVEPSPKKKSATASPASDTPTSQDTALAANTEQGQVSTPTSTVSSTATAAPVMAVAAVRASEASAVSSNVEAGQVQEVPTIDHGAQQMAVAA